MFFFLQILAIAVTLVTIYVCLKFKQLPFRLAYIIGAMAIDVAVYFFADYSTALYLAGMLLLAVPFVVGKKKEDDDKA